MNIFKRIKNLFAKDNDISDDYHTFGELYEHRCQLWILVCNCLCKEYEVFFIKNHFPDWDLVCLNIDGKQLSYHIPYINRLYLDLENINEKKVEDYVWDGHTPGDVLELIKKINISMGSKSYFEKILLTRN